MGEGEREKRERKPNVEVVIEGSCDVIGGDFGFDWKGKGVISTLRYLICDDLKLLCFSLQASVTSR